MQPVEPCKALRLHLIFFKSHSMNDAYMVIILYRSRNSSFAGTDLGTLHEGSSHDYYGSNSVQLCE